MSDSNDELCLKLAFHIMEACDEFIDDNPETTNIDQMSALTMVLAKAITSSPTRDGHDEVAGAQDALGKAIQHLSVTQ